jgi:hypothetical protein
MREASFIQHTAFPIKLIPLVEKLDNTITNKQNKLRGLIPLANYNLATAACG